MLASMDERMVRIRIVDLAAIVAATDPVCGMTVDAEQAKANGLTTEHEGTTYHFCGRGCKLDFGEDPGRYLGPSHKPSM